MTRESTTENRPSLKQIWLAWEKLRVWYNTILFVAGIFGLWQLREITDYVLRKTGEDHAVMVGPKMIISFAVGANILYCLGPLLESLFFLILRRNLGRARYVPFVLGLGFSLLLMFLLGRRAWHHVWGWAI